MKRVVSLVLVFVFVGVSFGSLANFETKYERDILKEYGGVYRNGKDDFFVFRDSQLVFFIFFSETFAHYAIFSVVPMQYKGYTCLVNKDDIHNIEELPHFDVLYSDGENKVIFETNSKEISSLEVIEDYYLYDPSISEDDIFSRYIETGSFKNPCVGMTAREVKASTWGNPSKINKTTYVWGTEEQWVYPNNRYIYFEDGYVTAISEQLE